jgi:hypothetical protein
VSTKSKPCEQAAVQGKSSDQITNKTRAATDLSCISTGKVKDQHTCTREQREAIQGIQESLCSFSEKDEKLTINKEKAETKAVAAARPTPPWESQPLLAVAAPRSQTCYTAQSFYTAHSSLGQTTTTDPTTRSR